MKRFKTKFKRFWFFLKLFEVCLGYMCVSGTIVSGIHVCVGSKCVGMRVCVRCTCVSDTCVCRIHVCVGYKCVSGKSVCLVFKFSGTCKPDSRYTSKYSKHWPYHLAATMNCGSSKMLNHGLNLELFLLIFKVFGWKYVPDWIENLRCFYLMYKLICLLDVQVNLPHTSPFLSDQVTMLSIFFQVFMVL